MRNRGIKWSFWDDERVAAWPPESRLCYIALWCEADDHGRLRASLPYLARRLFPYDTNWNFGAVIAPIVTSGKLVLYRVNGEQFGFLPAFTRHQTISRPSKSRLPDPGAGERVFIDVLGQITDDPSNYTNNSMSQQNNSMSSHTLDIDNSVSQQVRDIDDSMSCTEGSIPKRQDKDIDKTRTPPFPPKGECEEVDDPYLFQVVETLDLLLGTKRFGDLAGDDFREAYLDFYRSRLPAKRKSFGPEKVRLDLQACVDLGGKVVAIGALRHSTHDATWTRIEAPPPKRGAKKEPAAGGCDVERDPLAYRAAMAVGGGPVQ